MKKNRKLPDHFDEEISFWAKVENEITAFMLFAVVTLGIVSIIHLTKPWTMFQ